MRIVISQDAGQRKLDEVHKGIHNVTGIPDDILICGITELEHYETFIKVLHATRETFVSFYSGKLQFKQPQVVLWSHSNIERNPTSWRQT